jgi:hypothetical protein
MATTIGTAALATVNLLIAQGATFTATLRYLVGNPPTGVDLTGWTARSQLRGSVGGDLWLTSTHTDRITLAADGTITLTIPHTLTEDPAWNNRNQGVWDLELVTPAGARVRFVQGTVSIDHDVTRDA